MKMAETVSLSIRSVINDSNWARVKSDLDRFQARTGATPVCFALWLIKLYESNDCISAF